MGGQRIGEGVHPIAYRATHAWKHDAGGIGRAQGCSGIGGFEGLGGSRLGGLGMEVLSSYQALDSCRNTPKSTDLNDKF